MSFSCNSNIIIKFQMYFILLFLRMFKYLLRDDIRIMIRKFHSIAFYTFSSYFTRMILKVKPILPLEVFSPISQLGSLYKYVVKFAEMKKNWVIRSHTGKALTRCVYKIAPESCSHPCQVFLSL